MEGTIIKAIITVGNIPNTYSKFILCLNFNVDKIESKPSFNTNAFDVALNK